eukprot:COSAG06_NODE_31448_length_521_cov_1.327014_1_plen_32_part_10
MGCACGMTTAALKQKDGMWEQTLIVFSGAPSP